MADDGITGRNLPPQQYRPLHLHPVMFEPHARIRMASTGQPGTGSATVKIEHAAQVDAILLAHCAECPEWHPEVDPGHTAPELLNATLQHSGLNDTPEGREVLALLARLAET